MKNIVIAAVLAAGLCAAFFAGRLTVAAVNMAGEGEQAPEAAPRDDSGELARAQRRIAQLERRLEAANAAARKAEAEAAKEKDARAEEQEGNQSVVIKTDSGEGLLDALKKNLSAEDFEKATNAMGRLRARMAAKARDRIDFLKSVGTDDMTDEDRANHEKFIELMERREAVRAGMAGGFPDPKSIQELMGIEMQTMQLAKKERTALAGELARELGYEGEDADAVKDAVQNIFNATNGGGLGGMMDMVEGDKGGGGVSIQTQVIAP